ncbi:chemotaxis protein CheW [Pseudomonas sp. MBLB4123]|uniref:chemotaxis protein CheW n=1 Tax=Pseudomonas sp. MBLB4123 TaxID=3451557 RepID=UPI003F74D26A
MDRYQVLPFDLAGQHLAVALEQVVRVLPALHVSPLPGAPKTIRGLANVRGQLLPVVDLPRRFGWDAPEPSLWQPFIWLTSSTRELLLPVERVEAVSTYASEHFTPAPDPRVPSSLLRGVVRNRDGLLLIQDVEQLLSHEDELQLDTLLAAREGVFDAVQ